MTLDKAKSEQKVRIVRINGGAGVRQKLHQLGIFEGGWVCVKRHSHFGGPLIIEYDLCEVALGHGMAEKIDVQGESNSGHV
jgi:Fe2+ transport system protein FeoA